MQETDKESEIQRLTNLRNELWKQIKDFTTTPYEEAERVGKRIRVINRKIESLKKG